MDLHDLQLRRDEVEDLGDVLADQAQYAAAIGAALTGIEHDGLARRVIGDAGLAAPSRRDAVGRGGPVGRRLLGFRGVRFGRRIDGGAGGLEAFEREFQLFDLALDLLRARAEALLLEPGDGEPECLHQRLVGAVGSRHPGILRPQAQHHRLQSRGVFGEGAGLVRHGRIISDAGDQNQVKSLI